METKNKALEKALEKAVIDKIKSYTYNMARYAETKEKIKSITCKTTSTYGNVAAASSKSFKSKVEQTGNVLYELHTKEKDLKVKLIEIERMIEYSGLNDNEKALMWWIARTGNIQAYARRYHVGKDNVYKIRDRAVRKMLEYKNHKM